MTDPPVGAGYQLESLGYSAGTGGWVGVWLDTPFGFRPHPVVTLHAPTRDGVRVLAAQRGLPWTDLADDDPADGYRR